MIAIGRQAAECPRSPCTKISINRQLPTVPRTRVPSYKNAQRPPITAQLAAEAQTLKMDTLTREHYHSRLHEAFLKPFYTKDAAAVTHVCMAGGRYSLPPAKEHRLPVMLAAEIESGGREYMCEVMGGRFKFFLDLDLPPLTEEQHDSLCCDVASVLFIIGAVAPTGLVLFASCHTQDKSGYHVYTPGLEVSRAEAEALAGMVRALASAWWAPAVDTTPYKGSLRMLYASKACNKTHIGREYHLERVYVAHDDYVSEDKALLEELRRDTARAIALCAVRVPGCDNTDTRARSDTSRSHRRSGHADATVPAEAPFVGVGLGVGPVTVTKWRIGSDALILQTQTRMCPRIGREHKQRCVAILLKAHDVHLLCMDDVCTGGTGKSSVVASKPWTLLLEELPQLQAVHAWATAAIAQV